MSTPPPPMPQSALPQEQVQPALSEPARIINAFVAPRKTFEDIRRKQSWFWPWLISAIVGVAFAFVAVQKIDTAQMVRQAMERSPAAQRRMEQASPEQRDRMIEIQAKVSKVAFFVIPTVGGLILGLVLAAVLLGVFNFGFGTDVSFRHALSITFYSLLPGIIGAILLIANMVQVAAYTRRTEIGIMRLVGATRWYTQLPFLVEAMLAAFIGVVLALIGLLTVRTLFLEKALSQFTQANLIAPLDFADILYIAPILLFVGVVMAGVTAYVTLRLYVRR